MSSHLGRKLRVAEPEAGATFSLYANDRGKTQWSINMPVVCFCHLSQMDMELPLPLCPPSSTFEIKKKGKQLLVDSSRLTSLEVRRK